MVHVLLYVEQLAWYLNNARVISNGTVRQVQGLSDKSLNIEVPDCEGTSRNPEYYIERENSLERYFDFKGLLRNKKYKLAMVKLIKLAPI